MARHCLVGQADPSLYAVAERAVLSATPLGGPRTSALSNRGFQLSLSCSSSSSSSGRHSVVIAQEDIDRFALTVARSIAFPTSFLVGGSLCKRRVCSWCVTASLPRRVGASADAPEPRLCVPTGPLRGAAVQRSRLLRVSVLHRPARASRRQGSRGVSSLLLGEPQTVRKLRDTFSAASFSRPTTAQSGKNRENRFPARPNGTSH